MAMIMAATITDTDPVTSDPFPNHRANVGIVLFHTDGRVWTGCRNGTEPPWQWQFPQGGIDPGESPEAAAIRELYEETGITADKVEALGAINHWLAYDYPDEIRDDPRFARKRHLGQKQRWFAYRFLGADSDFDLDCHGEVEFSDWRWDDLAGMPERIIPWKRDVYRQVVTAFSQYTADGANT